METKKIWYQLSLKTGIIKLGSLLKNISNFLNIDPIKNIKLNSKSKILDIGCGRGKIVGTLSSKLRLKNKPLGIDIINHKDKDKRIEFKKIDASSFYFRNEDKFDLILIKQTIHLLNLDELKDFIYIKKKFKNKWKNFYIYIRYC